MGSTKRGMGLSKMGIRVNKNIGWVSNNGDEGQEKRDGVNKKGGWRLTDSEWGHQNREWGSTKRGIGSTKT